MTHATVTGIVLAGGRASRFGGPKLAARLDGEPLLALAVRAVAVVADEVVIAGPAPETLDSFGDVAITVIPDATPFEGPLVAVAGALHAARGELAIVVGGDMPRLAPRVLRGMLDRLDSDRAVDAVRLELPPGEPGASQRLPTLPLALRVEPGAAAADQAIEAGDRSLIRLLERLRTIPLPVGEWLALDPEGRTLLDVDRPADIEPLRGSDFR